jgi:hypothetical protein
LGLSTLLVAPCRNFFFIIFYFNFFFTASWELCGILVKQRGNCRSFSQGFPFPRWNGGMIVVATDLEVDMSDPDRGVV